MKKLLTTLAILSVTSMVMGQSHGKNYVKTTTYQVETQDGITAVSTQANLTDDDKIEVITYYDGLGRPEQSIAKQAGGHMEDIVTPMVYDNMGRMAKEYLPYADQSALAGESLKYRDPTTLMSDLNSFYLAKYPSELLTADPNPYSEKHFERTPLNRILEQGAPGKDWAVDETSDDDHTIKFEYETNILEPGKELADNVINYDVIFPTGNTEEPELFFAGYYDSNELYKTVTKDENWNETAHGSYNYSSIEYKNKQGQVLLKRNFNNEIPHDTYYVYDDFGNLTYVLSPSGSDNLLIQGVYKPYSQTLNYDEFIEKGSKGAPAVTGTGDVTIEQNSIDNELKVQFNLHYDSPVELITGKIATLADFTPDMLIGTIVSSGASYQISIVDNDLYLTGSGLIQNLTDTFIVSLPTFVPDPKVLGNFCYEYHYDSRNRLIEKRIPGKEWEFIVYDKLDRPVLTQDANLRQTNHWLFTKYDDFGRVVYTGKHYYFVINEGPGIYANYGRKLLQADLDNQMEFSEERNEDTNPTTVGNVQLYHANKVLPMDDIEIYTINYYDTYPPDITGAGSSGAFTDPVSVVLNGVTTPTTDNTNSLSTGTRVRVLDTNDWITSVSYYDHKARPIYGASENEYLGTLDVTKNLYDFMGKVLRTVTEHTKGTNPVITTIDSYTYDHAGRLLSQKQNLDTNQPEIIVKNYYDRFGQLEGKNVGNTEATPLQTINYGYNIRGWMTKINDVNSLGNCLFGFQISYNDMEYNNVQSLYNGNITETIWSTKSVFTNANNVVETELVRAYSYEYDQLNRIKKGVYEEEDALRDDWYNLKEVDYDKNGNIIELRRSGVNTSGSYISKMDELSYSYEGNKLIDIKESGSTTLGFTEVGIFPGDYDYDANGNMVEDKNKGIDAIAYNHLNLPVQVTFDANNDITYIYDATGIKLEKQVKENGVMTYTRYAGNYIYEEVTAVEELKFMNHAEGYVEPSATNGYDYVYQYKDHLGNVRLSYKNVGTTSTPSLEILEENNYYPFGLKHKGYNNNVSANSNSAASKFKYNGKELEEGLGYNMYEMDMRSYDPAIARWTSIDPITHHSMSTYTAFDNNPVFWADPSGADSETFFKSKFLNEMMGGHWTDALNDTDPKKNKKKKETAVQKTARKAITSLAEKANEKSEGKMSTPANDSSVDAYQLFYQWVMGTGPDSRNFDENSTMGKQMLGSPEVREAIVIAAQQAACGDDCSDVAFFRSLRGENPITYALDDFPRDIGGRNPARGFHGSFAGKIAINNIVEVEGGSIIRMTISISDKMTAVSGTRASGTVGGYDKKNPIAIYPTENPYGPRGQFRTINVNYRLNVEYFQPTND